MRTRLIGRTLGAASLQANSLFLEGQKGSEENTCHLLDLKIFKNISEITMF